MKFRDTYTCPLELTHDLIKGKWKPILLWQIGKNNIQSFSALKHSIPAMSEKMLTEQLNELLATQLINKDKTTTYPLKVTYTLTPYGEKLLTAITIMQEVGSDMLER